MKSAEYFEKNRYVYLSDIITQEECKDLTEHMFKLSDEGKLEYDPQCPLSGAVYGDSILDAVLDRLAKPLSAHLGIELLPTYTYARLYKPGEELKRHSDRPSCEISGTMTLGYDPEQDVWPIFFAKNEEDQQGKSVDIEVGDLVMYRGTELPHWRPKFEGTWQVQVFFHYVDANGPYKEYKYDKRERLGLAKPIDKEEEPQQQQIIFNYFNHGRLIGLQDGVSPMPVTFCNTFRSDLIFTPEECNKIIEFGKNNITRKASIGDESASRVDTKIRSVNECHIALGDPDHDWIYDKLGFAVAVANTEYFKFNLLGIIHSIQLLHYKGSDNDHYDWHVDVGGESAATRKISVSIPLSNPTDYEGGDLQFNTGAVTGTPKDQGCISMFPSYMLHRVSPVTKGERWVMVMWIHGSDRFK